MALASSPPPPFEAVSKPTPRLREPPFHEAGRIRHTDRGVLSQSSGIPAGEDVIAVLGRVARPDGQAIEVGRGVDHLRRVFHPEPGIGVDAEVCTSALVLNHVLLTPIIPPMPAPGAATVALKAALSVLPILSVPNDPLIVMWVLVERPRGLRVSVLTGRTQLPVDGHRNAVVQRGGPRNSRTRIRG